MNHAFMWYWKNRLRDVESEWARYAYAYTACGPAGGRDRGDPFGRSFSRRRAHDPAGRAAGVGTRRPLRVLAQRLDLDPDQVTRTAKILDRLKLERAQASVDLRRAASDLAEAVEGSEFGRAALDSARDRRIEAARRVQDALAAALEELHALLDAEQREKLATLIRTEVIRL